MKKILHAPWVLVLSLFNALQRYKPRTFPSPSEKGEGGFLKDYDQLLKTAPDGTKYIGTYKNYAGTVAKKTTKVLVSIDNDGIMWNFLPTL